jgi:hypothetical protein
VREEGRYWENVKELFFIFDGCILLRLLLQSWGAIDGAPKIAVKELD